MIWKRRRQNILKNKRKHNPCIQDEFFLKITAYVFYTMETPANHIVHLSIVQFF